MRFTIVSEQAMAAFGGRLAAALDDGLCITLSGPLGAGKTTLVRALLRGLGHAGAVKSPTYTLLESYEIGGRRLHHLDFYRLADPAELEYIGLRDLLEPGVVCLIEWPERAGDQLPPVDLAITIAIDGGQRRLALAAMTATGERVLARLAQHSAG